MSVKRLAETLGELGDIVEAAGAKKVADGLRTIRGLFERDADRNANEALEELRSVLASEKSTLRLTYLKRLNEAGTDAAKFDAVAKELEQSKQMGKEDIDSIAHDFTGGRKKWPSRKAGIQALAASHASGFLDARHLGRERHILFVLASTPPMLRPNQSSNKEST